MSGPASFEPAATALRIDKQRVPVRIAQLHRDPVDGFFCLVPGQETILELLNGPSRVIPFLVKDDGSVRLLTRLNLDWVIAAEQTPGYLLKPRRAGAMREEPIEVEFLNGTTIDGLLQICPDSHRASDFLNSDADFYPMRTRLGTLLVNKRRVVETRLGTCRPKWDGVTTP